MRYRSSTVCVLMTAASPLLAVAPLPASSRCFPLLPATERYSRLGMLCFRGDAFTLSCDAVSQLNCLRVNDSGVTLACSSSTTRFAVAPLPAAERYSRLGMLCFHGDAFTLSCDAVSEFAC
jgi:hypothetical protein